MLRVWQLLKEKKGKTVATVSKKGILTKKPFVFTVFISFKTLKPESQNFLDSGLRKP